MTHSAKPTSMDTLLTLGSLPRRTVLACGLASPLLARAQPSATGAGLGPIRLGQSAGFSGGQAEYAADVNAGLKAALAAANQAGGVAGRRLELVTADDGGRRDAVLENTRKLVEQDQVVALVGYTSGAGVEASLAYIDRMRVPIIGPATGNMGIREAGSPNLFHTRAGYDREMSAIVSHVARLGYQRVGLAYLADVGPANLRAMTAALAQHRLEPAVVVGLDRNATDFSQPSRALLAARPQLVVFISNARPIVGIVKAMRRAGYGGQFATSSFAGSRVVADLGAQAAGLILIQVLPRPQKNYLRFHRAFHEDLAAHAASTKANYTVLEGYVAGRVLTEALRRAGAEGGRSGLLRALSNLGEIDFGGYRVRYAANAREGSRFVELGVVTDDGRIVF